MMKKSWQVKIRLRIYTAAALVGVTFLLHSSPVWAGEAQTQTQSQTVSGTIELSKPEDLLSIKDHSDGSYILTRDIDMAGIAWEPADFGGVFDGNGHAILNLTVTSPGSTTAVTYDGNMKEYETVFAGFFGKLENAEVKNLKLVNAEVTVETNQNCFLGGIAGYADNSTITGCEVTGRLWLTVDAPMFGVGGIVGFGNGSIEETVADTTLVCIDTNAEERDEQFLGGAYAAGYLNLNDCDVAVQGYISDHGYVHSGGLVGMYGIYPKGNTYEGYITDNYITGKITFFEDNKNRRAYCKAYIGEVLHWTYEWHGCREKFEKDERFDYSVNLVPEGCEVPNYESLVTASTETEYGYTTYTCAGCGYSYRDDYVLKTGDLALLEAEARAEAERLEAERLAAEKAEAEAKAAEEAAKTEQARRELLEDIRKAEEDKLRAEEEAGAEAERRAKEPAWDSVEMEVLPYTILCGIVIWFVAWLKKKKKNKQ